MLRRLVVSPCYLSSRVLCTQPGTGPPCHFLQSHSLPTCKNRPNFLHISNRHFFGQSQSGTKNSLAKKLVGEYGGVFFVFHTCTSIVTLCTLYFCVSRGFDVSVVVSMAENFVSVDSILEKLGYDKSILLATGPSSTTAGVLAFVLLKLTSPIRLMLDVLMVPLIVTAFKHVGLLAPIQVPKESTVEKGISKLEDSGFDVDPVVKVIRSRVRERDRRRTIQLKKHQDLHRKIGKVFNKKNNKPE